MKNNVINHISNSECTGCCACVNVCPKDALYIEENNEGFLFPKIDEIKCIDCGLCLQKCPVENPRYINTNNPECRAVWAQDSIRIHAASGGVFSAFAQIILKQGGIVCGAAFNNDFSVGHIIIKNADELQNLLSSKYIQSNIGNIYREIKKYLDENYEVLFSGCPCQVAGLYAYLGESDIPNLYTMDLVCHGVPSSKLFRKYLNENIGSEKIESIDFRNKELFGWSSSIVIKLKNGKIYKNTHVQDSFYRAFLNSLGVRKSCSNCKFSCLPRQGDVTIGDFWGISKYRKELNDNRGTSLVLINNKKGNEIIKECEKLFTQNEILPIEAAISGNKAIVGSFKAHPARKRFFDNLDRAKLDKLVNDCLSHHYDVGIVGLWYGLNYGSILTYFALNKVITDLGYQCLMINKPKVLWNERFEDRNSVANRFIYKNCYVSNVRKNYEDWMNLSDQCDMFVVGSDVVWNYDVCGKQSGHFFYLDFVKNSKKKIAYASSLGSGPSNNIEYEGLAKYYLDKFDAISVREENAVQIFKQNYHLNVEQVMDPVFLCDIRYYLQAINESKVQESRKILTTYFLGPNAKKREVILALSKMLNLEYRNLYNPNEDTAKLEMRLGLPLLKNVSVEDWLYYMKKCDFYIGDSYHGLCFALIFKKPFIILVDRHLPSRNRFDSLLNLIGLEDRMAYLDSPMEDILKIADKQINYSKIEQYLIQYKNKSYTWLKEALRDEKKVTCTPTDFMIDKLQKEIAILQSKLETEN